MVRKSAVSSCLRVSSVDGILTPTFDNLWAGSMFPNAITLGRFTALGRFEKLLLVISLIAGFGFLFTRSLEPYPGSVVVKALGVSPLALFTLRLLKDRDGLILGTSLIFSVGGDVFLGLNREDFFVFGLGSFLVAHLLYIFLFIRSMPMRLILSPLRKAGVTLLVLYSVIMLAWMLPSLGELAIPVIVYITVITGMGVSAALAGFRAPWVLVGSILFILSDSVIAVNKFKIPFAASAYLIWSMYYIGQYLIVMGYVREKIREGWVAHPAF